jgi:hypothetical protein
MAIINDGNRQAITNLVVELRENGEKWDVEGGIRDQVEAKFPVYKSKSAIPLRKLYHAAVADKFDPTKAAGRKLLLKLRDGGAGWAQLSVRTGKSEGELKKLYTEAGGQFPTNGRLYVATDGTVNHVAEATSAIHKARLAQGETTEDTPATPAEPTEAPATPTKRRRRRQAAA